MRVSTLIRGSLVGLAVAALAACSDSPAAPNQARTIAIQAPAYLKADRGPKPRAGASDNAKVFADRNAAFDSTSFDLSPMGGVFKFGSHVLYVAPGALCDLSSPYGVQYFNDAASCAPATQSVKVTAVWATRRGHAYIEFEPALRFNPAPDAPPAILALFDKVAITSGDAILWRDPNTGWIDESLTDPTLATQYEGTNVAWRRIKHFSGYNVSASLDDAFMMY